MKLTYEEQIEKEIKKSFKMKNATRLWYYIEMRNYIACASFEVFKDSWAFESWFKKNKTDIEQYVESTNRRFVFGTWTV